MPKFKLRDTVYFNGTPFPAGSVIDTDVVPMNGESMVTWGWATQVDDDTPADPLPSMDPAPSVEPESTKPVVEPGDVESTPEPEPEPVKPKRKPRA